MPAPAYAIAAVQVPLSAGLNVWHTATAQPLVITYAFENQASAAFLRSFPGFAAWTAEEKAAVRWGLDEYETVINVRFVEVASGSGGADIVFGRADVGYGGDARWRIFSAVDGSGQVTSKSRDASIVWDNGIDLADPSARYVILHEIGHAMLMKHVGPYDLSGGTTPAPYLPEAEDNRDYTVMSYNLGENAAVARQLQVYDVAALQARWGANTHEAAGDSVYTFDDDPGIFAIWDTGGIDRIDASAAAGAADIDLAEGAFSQLAGQNRMSIAWGVEIEEAAGSAFADRIRGNSLDNRLMGGSGDDTIQGVGGANYLRGEDGDDWIVGGDDTDDAHGNMGNDTVQGGAGDDWVVGGKDDDLLYGEAGADIVYGNLGNDTCDGGDGNDIVRGGQGDDIVRGGAGDDFVSGDRGDDTLWGGPGADRFHTFAGSGVDRVMDFNRAEGDRVELLPGALAGTTYSQVGADVVIETGDGARLILVGVQLSSLDAGWIG